jgi:hypothetical protein
VPFSMSSKDGDCMKLSDHLSDKQKRELRQINLPKGKKPKQPKKKPKKKEEKVNWHEMMGINRDTFKRGKGGAIRRK